MSSAQADIRAVVTADDQGASSTLSNVGEKLGGVKSALSDVMSTALGFNLANVMIEAEAKVKEFISSAISDYEQYQAVNAQLQAVLISTNNQYQLTKTQIDNLGESLQKNTTYNKTQTDQALTLLLSFQNLGTTGIQPILDLSADLATRMGSTLPQAAQTLGRALQDPQNGARLLRSVGIDLSTQLQKQLTDMSKSGDIAGAQAIIMDLLKQKVGGAADAYKNTLPGAIATANRSIEEFKVAGVQDTIKWLDQLYLDFNKNILPTLQVIGNFLKSAFTPLFENLASVIKTDVMPVFERHKTQIEDLTKIIIGFATFGLVVMIATVYAAIAVWTAIIAVFSWLINVITDVINWFRNLTKTITDFFSNLETMISNAVGNAESWLYKTGKQIITGLIKGITDSISGVGSAIGNVASGIGGAVSGALHNMHIPGFATGGIVPGSKGEPMLAVVHGGETIIPANQTPASSQTSSSTSTNQNVTVNISVNAQAFMGSQIQARQFAMQIFTALQDYATSKNTSIASMVGS